MIFNTKAVAYMRYSSDHQTENSIEYQRENILNYCNKNRIELVKEFVDEAYSGTNDRRPAFQRMIKEVQTCPDWDQVLVFDFSRFARNVVDAFRYREILQDYGISLVSITQDYGDSEDAYLIKGLHHLFDAQYSLKNSNHTHAGMKVRAQQGFHCGGTPPLGYNVGEEKKLIINRKEACIVQEIFDLYENGYSYAQMEQILNNKGYRTKAGALFKKNSFRSILRQKKYIGIYRWDTTQKKDRKGRRNSNKHKPIEEQTILPGGCPAIITKEQFDRVQAMFKDRREGKAESKSRHHYMLSGLKILKCAECGSYLIGNMGNSHGKPYQEYYCPNHRKKTCPTKNIRADQLNHWVAGLLAKDFYQRKDFDKINAQMMDSEEYQLMKNRLKGIDLAQRNTLKALEYGNVKILSKRLRELSEEKEALTEEITKYESGTKTVTDENKKAMANKLARFLRDSEALPVRRYLKSMIQEITVSNDSVSMITTDF